jgi:hypothetical protein
MALIELDVAEGALPGLSPAFAPGDQAPVSGTYSCFYCTAEVIAAEGEELPVCAHVYHRIGTYRGLPTEWRLLGATRRR